MIDPEKVVCHRTQRAGPARRYGLEPVQCRKEYQMSAASDFRHSDADSDQGRLDVLAAAVMDVVEDPLRPVVDCY